MIFTICIFYAGLIWASKIVLAIILCFIGLFLQLYLIKKQDNELKKKIVGRGVTSISVSTTPPENPGSGDLWVDISEEKK